MNSYLNNSKIVYSYPLHGVINLQTILNLIPELHWHHFRIWKRKINYQVKTIISIIEVLIYNLLPASVAAQLAIILSDVVPMVGVALTRIGAYIITGLKKLQHTKFQHTTLLKAYLNKKESRINFH